MKLKKAIKNKIKKIKIRLDLVIIFLILIFLFIFLISNFFVSLSLKKQLNSLLVISSNKQVSQGNSEVITQSNTFSEPFFNRHFIDDSRTNMFFDEKVTALTFKPIYDFNFERDCSGSDCELESAISKKIKTPSELADKNIKSVFYNQLGKKILVSYIISVDKEEQVYVYLVDDKKITPLITDSTKQKIKTQYGRGNGFVSAGGSDDQFIVWYSGYEALAFLYNNGQWQDLSPYLGLRVADGGFKSKVIKDGQGNDAVWYLCADDGVKGRLIKLWQNDTEIIQGSLDLSSVLSGKAAKCFYKGNRELNIVSDNQLSIFKDKGFDNSLNYYYSSNNINSYTDKKVAQIYFLKVSINAAKNSYSIFTSANQEDWQPVNSQEVSFDNKGLNEAYIRVEFSSDGGEYSPWFDGLENIFYVTRDR